MARGGFRPGAGRKKGTGKKEKTETKKMLPTHETEENRKLRELLSYDRKAKAKIYHEFVNRLGKGDALSITEKKFMDKIGAELSAELNKAERIEAAAENLTPLDYMLKVMNDPQAEKERRDRMAQAAAPYIHARAGEGVGKKDEKAERAERAAQGKFAPGKPPELKVIR